MKENRRIQMTKMLLRESLFELLEEKPIGKITIKEICENADINRSTFYKYYGDQFALLKEVEDELIQKTAEFVFNLNAEDNKLTILEDFLGYVKKNADIFRIVLSTNGNTQFRYKLYNIVMQRLIAENYAVDANDDIRFVLGIVIMEKINLIMN